MEDIRQQSWYPSGIATHLELVTESSSPNGFSIYKLATKWGSFDIYWPEDGLDQPSKWNQVLSEGTWGKIPEISLVEQIGEMRWLLTTQNDFQIEAQILPLDLDGNGHRLAELSHSGLLHANGGVQHDGRDVILLYNHIVGSTDSSTILLELLEQGNIAKAEQLLNSIGIALGRFHTTAASFKALPCDQKRWNDRLKKLEASLNINTLWRAPHSPETRTTITHRNFSLDIVLVDDSEDIIISGTHDFIQNRIIGCETRNPAIRDLAAGYVSLRSTLHSGGFPEHETRLRRALFQGWSSTCPPSIRSNRALDGHRGGVIIWEYERMLELKAESIACGSKTEKHVDQWLSEVTGIQALMFTSRLWSAFSLLCFFAAGILLFGSAWGIVSRFDLLFAPIFILMGFGFRWIYRSKAPSPF